jgi:5-dehydro-4-deoxyglucarate dehydratase
MTPQELKDAVPRGMLSFPLTDFGADGEFDPKASAARLEWLSKYPSSALFMAGGAGEFFSLTPAEFSAVIGTAVTAVVGERPSSPAAAMARAPRSNTPRRPSDSAQTACC